jgi:glutathione S-transferase
MEDGSFGGFVVGVRCVQSRTSPRRTERMMKLYYHPVSTTSRPVVLFAADHRIEVLYHVVDLIAGEQTQPPFSALNPNQSVPMLEDGDFRLTESAAILKYLADRVGSPAYPLDLRQRARVNERMDWINTALSPQLGAGFVYPQILPTHKRPDEHAQRHTIAWARAKARRSLSVLNDHILGAENRYLCGNQLTIADYLGVAHVTLAEAVHVDFSRWPHIAQWIARMKDRQNWASVNDPFYRYLVQPFAKASFEPL